MKAFTEISLLIIGILLFVVGASGCASPFPYNLIPILIGGIIIGRFVSILKLKK
jgi:hypothetical protein